jgi:regulator of replication initiation timing
MSEKPLDPALLAEKIQQAEAKLNKLAHEIEEIGQPAAQELSPRVTALKIEENALKRNFAESQQSAEPDPTKMQKIKTLLHHIEREESAVEHDAECLNQAALSSVTLAVPAGTHVVEFFRQGADRTAEKDGE